MWDGGVRRGLVPRDAAVPEEPGDRHRACLPPDPDRVSRAGSPARLGGGPRGAAPCWPTPGAREVLRLFGSAGVRMHCPPPRTPLTSCGARPRTSTWCAGVRTAGGCGGCSPRAATRWTATCWWRWRAAATCSATRAAAWTWTSGSTTWSSATPSRCGTGSAARDPTLPLEDLLSRSCRSSGDGHRPAGRHPRMLATHEVVRPGSEGREEIDATHIARVLGRDWGFWRTATANLAATAVPTRATSPPRRRRAGPPCWRRRGAPKSLRWKVRARVGERIQWWQDVDAAEAGRRVPAAAPGVRAPGAGRR